MPEPADSIPDESTTRPRALRLGVAGPVGTGKSSLIALLCRELGTRLSVAVVTNDIYTDEDARFLRSAGVLAPERIRAVETGACPHTAIRDDVSQNLLAVEDLERDFAPVDLVLVESGGDNLTATFSPALVDAQFFVLDVAGGGDVARKGGPGIARADVLVVNKTDLAPYVGVDVEQMVADAEHARDGRRVIALSRSDAASVAKVTGWVLDTLQTHRSGALVPQDPGPMAPHSHAPEPQLPGEDTWNGQREQVRAPHRHADGTVHSHSTPGQHTHQPGQHAHEVGHDLNEAGVHSDAARPHADEVGPWAHEAGPRGSIMPGAGADAARPGR